MERTCNNDFWKVCAAIDNPIRLDLVRYLLSVETTAFPCVIELAEHFKLSASATSIYLRKLADAGLVSCKRTDSRIYYRAFATTPAGERVIAALRDFFQTNPTAERMHDFGRYVHVLSHYRRNAIVRCLAATQNFDMRELAIRTGIPYPSADRLLADLNKAHIVDLNGIVIPPSNPRSPEATFLELTLA